MLTFFRRIRKGLLGSGKVRKPASPAGRYILYAIGEILLVMVGILLALQVNNWNERRKEKLQEKAIVSNLTLEFKQNQELLFMVQEETDNTLSACRILLNLTGKRKEEIINVNLDSLIFLSWAGKKYTPNQNILEGLFVSDRIDLIRSENTKNLLFQWINELDQNEDKYINVNNATDNKYYDYLSRNYSFKDIDIYSDLNWSERSKISYNAYKILGDLEFENHVENMAFVLFEYGNSLNTLQTILAQVLASLEK